MTPLERFKHDFKGKRILIMGLGMLGRGVGDALFLHSLGNPLRITDLKSDDQLRPSLEKLAGIAADFILREHRQEDIDWADVIVRNAGVPWRHPLLEYARQQNKEIVMDTQLFITYADIPTIGITGTRGKTTTTMMVHHVLSQATSRQVLLGGNINHVASLPLLSQINPQKDPVAVLELSSWQLQAFRAHRVAPHIAVITNLYPDHLNRYPSLKEYYNDKFAIIEHQTKGDVACLNKNQPECKDFAKKTAAQVQWFESDDISSKITLSVPGAHNRENAAAARCACEAFGLSASQILQHLKTFKGVHYRLEKIAQKNNISFYNDTTATTPTATIKALQSFDKPVILIVGGETKNLPLGELPEVIGHHASSVILLKGSGTEQLMPHLDNQGQVHDTLESAVSEAVRQAQPGDSILFSPAFTSFGMWQNEFHRGQEFNQLVDRL